MTRLGEAPGAALVLVAAALALSGCGGGGGSTATRPRAPAQTGTAAGKPPARGGEASARGCGLGGLVHALYTLENRLAAGLSYEQYFTEVKGARDAYEAVPVQALDLPCLGAVGTPAERALDKYIEAANAWRGCRADAGCATYSIEPRLQKAWRVASHYLAEVRKG